MLDRRTCACIGPVVSADDTCVLLNLTVCPRVFCVIIARIGMLASDGSGPSACSSASSMSLCGLAWTQYPTDTLKAQARGPSVPTRAEACRTTAVRETPDGINTLEKTSNHRTGNYAPVLATALGNGAVASTAQRACRCPTSANSQRLGLRGNTR